MRRGDLVTVASPGDFGKPRPALVVQADRFAETGTITVLLLSGMLIDAPLVRINVQPTVMNGLRKASQIMIDKATSMKRDKVGAAFGRLEAESMVAVNRSLALFFGLG